MDMFRVQVASCLVCCCGLSTNELVDATLGTNYAQDFDLNVDVDSIYVDDVAPHTVNM